MSSASQKNVESWVHVFAGNYVWLYLVPLIMFYLLYQLFCGNAKSIRKNPRGCTCSIILYTAWCPTENLSIPISSEIIKFYLFRRITRKLRLYYRTC